MINRTFALILCIVLIIGSFALCVNHVIPFWSFIIVFVIIRAIVPKAPSSPLDSNDPINPYDPRFRK